MNLTVNVSRQCINEGIRTDSNMCAVAIGLRRAVERKLRRRSILEVSVGSHLNVSTDDWDYEAETPLRVSNFIKRFDRGERQTLKPFRFRVRMA